MSLLHLFDRLDCILWSVTKLFSQWLGLNFFSSKKYSEAPCICCDAKYKGKLISRTNFKICGNNCQVSFYCLNNLGKVYIDPSSKDICEICRDIVLSKNRIDRNR